MIDDDHAEVGFWKVAVGSFLPFRDDLFLRHAKKRMDTLEYIENSRELLVSSCMGFPLYAIVLQRLVVHVVQDAKKQNYR